MRNAKQIVPLLCCLLAAAARADSVDFLNPVRSAALDQVTSLPGLSAPINFKHYSGYLNADYEQNLFWHYWFTESQSQPSKDPLLLWLNGGPGCSSLLGLLTELGPFRVADNYSVELNPFAWNKFANVIFLESPVEVGYSYAADGANYADDDTTAHSNHAALKSFLAKFPQYKDSPLYITGESYAGVYLPTLAVLLDADEEINFRGMAIGNAYLDTIRLGESRIHLSYYHGFISIEEWNKYAVACCDGKRPAIGQCHYADPNATLDCALSTWTVETMAYPADINPYNIYQKCLRGQHGSESRRSSRETVDRRLMLGPLEQRVKSHVRPDEVRELLADINRKLTTVPPCTDDSKEEDYLNLDEVREALHIPNELRATFTTCSDTLHYVQKYSIVRGGLAPQMQKLLASHRNLTLLLYNGDVDFVCDFLGDDLFTQALGRELVKDHAPWYTNNQVSGFVKHYDGITFMTVKGSGHMVPGDRPAEALHMLEMFLAGLKPDGAGE